MTGLLALDRFLFLCGALRGRRSIGRRQADQAAKILVIDPLRDDIGFDPRWRRALIEPERAGDVALADLAVEPIEGPQVTVVLELTAHAIGRGPRHRHRNDRIELRQVTSLERKHAVDVVDLGRNDRPLEARAGGAGPGADVERVRPLLMLERQDRRGSAFDGERLIAQAPRPRELHRRRSAFRGHRRCDVDGDVGPGIGIAKQHDTVLDGEAIDPRRGARIAHARELPVRASVSGALEHDSRLHQLHFGQRDTPVPKRGKIDTDGDPLRTGHHRFARPGCVTDGDRICADDRLSRNVDLQIAVDFDGPTDRRAHVARQRMPQHVPFEQGSSDRNNSRGSCQCYEGPACSGDSHLGCDVLTSLFSLEAPFLREVRLDGRQEVCRTMPRDCRALADTPAEASASWRRKTSLLYLQCRIQSDPERARYRVWLTGRKPCPTALFPSGNCQTERPASRARRPSCPAIWHDSCIGMFAVSNTLRRCALCR